MNPSEALKLERGNVYVLEAETFLSQQIRENIAQQLKPYEEQYGVSFIILDKGLRIARENP
jgi:hypothetical protein